MNEILKRNGCAPRWIELSKEIGIEHEGLIKEVRRIYLEWKKEPFYKQNMNFRDDHTWKLAQPVVEERVKHLNKLILDFNLIVPSTALQKWGVFVETFVKIVEQEMNEGQQKEQTA